MRLCALSFTAALLLAAAPAAIAQAQAARPAASAAVPAIDFTTRTLPNGLKVYAVRDTTTPNVSIQVWYDVGSKDDPEGRSGFAHLFEHMLFKTTRNMPSETIDRLTEDVGGFNNAFTADDVTAYFEVVPANHMERLLWAEAERMGNLVVDPAIFASERDVVKEEYRQRYLANPYGRLNIALTENSFQLHPYKRPGIGDIEQLDAATIEDVRAFHATYYRPDNAHLIVVGNFDPAQLNRWVDQYFGKVQRPAARIPRVTVKEPERRAARELTVYAPNVPLPAVAVSYPNVAANSPDAAAVDVLDAILSKGESSRLYRALVYEQQVAASVSIDNTQNAQAGYFAPTVIVAGGKSVADGERALLAEIAKIRDGGVTAAELEEAKTELLADALRERETVDGRGFALGEAIIFTGDARNADRELQQLQAVTAADVQRVAKQLLRDDRRVLIRYLNESERPANAPAQPAKAPPPKVADLTRTAKVTLIEPAPEGQRQRPPEPGAPRPVTAPKPVERTLANGLRVIVAPSGQLPLVAARLQVKAGAAEDPKGMPGVAAMTAGLLTQGTRTRPATAIASEVERLGADLSAGAGWDGTALSLNVLNTRLDPAMAVMADVAQNPAFADEELERQRAQALDGLQVAMSQPGSLASLLTPRVVFGEGPYGHPQNGTPESLKGMTTEALRRYHASRYGPANATLVLTGAITPQQGFALAEKHFGRWKATAAAAADLAAPPAPKPSTVIVDLPGTSQAAVVAARPSLRRTDPQYIPAQVAASVLGGGYSARLNQEIRIKRGLSYGAGAGLSARKHGGVLTASTQTKNESATEVTDLIQAELRELATDPLPAAELTARKSSLIGNFGRNIETVDGLATEIGNLTVFGLPLTELERYPTAVEAVTGDQVKAVAARELSPDAVSLIVVGDAKVFGTSLKAKHPNAVTVPAAEVDLDGPALRKSGR
jgi:zinc protease